MNNDEISIEARRIGEKYDVEIIPDSDYLPATNGIYVNDNKKRFFFRVHGILNDPENCLMIAEQEIIERISSIDKNVERGES